MCGIAGVLHLDDRQASPELLGNMIGLIRHRGPDAAELYVDRRLGFAHARLSIIDLANGRQPMQTTDGRLVITFNGEIFNYLELREALIERGHTFFTRSDTEVILHAYAEYGARCVEHFNGQWAFAIWDRLRGRLFLSRDRLGIRPLFYTQVGRTFLFASEVKALFACRDVRRELDPRGLDQLLTYWAPRAPQTLFRDVLELPPGHNLEVDGNRMQLSSYWRLDFGTRRQQSSADWCDELRELLTDATRLRLRADVPVGAYLSGGLDSSITTALAQRFTGDRLRTFSVTFDDDEFDESCYQRAVVESLGVEHQAMHCSYDDIARVFPQVVWHAEKPMLRTAPAPLQLLAELVHESGFKVVLTGEGADELLGGYDIFKEAKLRRFLASQPAASGRAALLEKLYPYLPNLQSQSVAMRQAFFRTTPGELESPFFSHLPRWNVTAQLKRLLTPEFQAEGEEGSDDPLSELAAALPRGFTSWRPFCQAQFLETEILLPGYILSSQGDRVAMTHSVEGRFPFLDYRLAELAAQIPPRLKMMGLNEKYLLKRAFRDSVPPQIFQRSKQPYRAPDAKSFFAADWQSAREPYVEELLSPERLQRAGVFQREAVQRLLVKVRCGRATGTRDNMALVAILSTQLLIDQFLENFPSPRAGTCRLPITDLPTTICSAALIR